MSYGGHFTSIFYWLKRKASKLWLAVFILTVNCTPFPSLSRYTLHFVDFVGAVFSTFIVGSPEQNAVTIPVSSRPVCSFLNMLGMKNREWTHARLMITLSQRFWKELVLEEISRNALNCMHACRVVGTLKRHIVWPQEWRAKIMSGNKTKARKEKEKCEN